jgi:hypothetical protein
MTEPCIDISKLISRLQNGASYEDRTDAADALTKLQESMAKMERSMLSAQSERDTALLLLRYARTQMNDMNLPLIAAIDNLLRLSPTLDRKKN